MDKTYKEHQVFTNLAEYADFYKSLSTLVFSFATQGTKSLVNIDSYVYSSMQGTLESINDILIKGRIGDSYALLRKYYDSVVINVYSNLYLKDARSRLEEKLTRLDTLTLEDFVVKKIDNWLNGKEQLPEYRVMSSYIRKSQKLLELNDLLYKDDIYKKIRNRCNDYTHYNFFYNVLFNDNGIYLKSRLKVLNIFLKDLENIFILHFSCIFYLNEHYMMSSDYLDCLECGVTPEEDHQYLVAPFIQEIFDTVIKKNRMDLAEKILKNTSMKLE